MADPVDRSGQGDDAIDAQFEPAPPSVDHVVTPEKPRKGPGWIALIVTGIVASTLGGGIGASFGSFGSSGELPESDVIAQLQEDQNTLGSRIAALGTDLEGAQNSLAAEIASIAEQAETQPDEEFADELSALQARMDLLSALPQGADGEDTGPLSKRLTVFEQALADLQTGQANRAEALAALSDRLQVAEAALSEAGEGIDQTQLVSLHQDISELKSQLAEAVSDTAERERLAGLIARAEERDAAAQTVQDADRASGGAALALVSLEAASERGVPFPEVMRALDTADADAGILADLRPIARTGAPTPDELIDQFALSLTSARAQGNAGNGADSAPTDDGWGWVRRTFGDSVKITRSEDAGAAVSGNEALETAAALAGDALGAGNISGAIAELDGLGETERAVFAPWLEAADKRVRLDAAMIALRASMLEQER
ncbi:MAG: hypothetical protein ABJG15_08050 [Hyphomonadaceae bacterium]